MQAGAALDQHLSFFFVFSISDLSKGGQPNVLLIRTDGNTQNCQVWGRSKQSVFFPVDVRGQLA